jgi:hypothetical protein|tara:strand:- start:571 stop:801 length:231 start_codon:yes stop_codon:yes gene_type:complete
MIVIDDNLKKILLIYLIGCLILFKMKPEIMFEKDGNFKPFGVGKDKTIAPYWLVTLIIGLSGYLYITLQSDTFVDN